MLQRSKPQTHTFEPLKQDAWFFFFDCSYNPSLGHVIKGHCSVHVPILMESSKNKREEKRWRARRGESGGSTRYSELAYLAVFLRLVRVGISVIIIVTSNIHHEKFKVLKKDQDERCPSRNHKNINLGFTKATK
jgi:hypothetical protein